MGNIIITAILKAKAGKEELLKGELLHVIEPSRNESGCVEYSLHESLDEPGVFVFYEAWKDEEALQMHIQSSHYKNYRQNAEELIETREVYRLRNVLS